MKAGGPDHLEIMCIELGYLRRTPEFLCPLRAFPGENVRERLAAIWDRRRGQHEMRTVDAVVPNLLVADPIGIRRPAYVMGHGASGRVQGIGAEVRQVTFERCPYFRIGACLWIARSE